MSQITPKITQVTVYLAHALVTREGVVELSPGNTTLEIPALPIRLDLNSVRVKGLSHMGTVIEGIDLKRISHTRAPEPDQTLLDKLDF